jgi:hypothetical protein
MHNPIFCDCKAENLLSHFGFAGVTLLGLPIAGVEPNMPAEFAGVEEIFLTTLLLYSCALGENLVAEAPRFPPA